MSDFQSEMTGISEKQAIFSLVFGFGSAIGAIFGYIFGFSYTFSEIVPNSDTLLILAFGFGWIFFVIGLVSLMSVHHNPATESEKVSAKAQVNTFEDVTVSNDEKDTEIIPGMLDETAPIRLNS